MWRVCWIRKDWLSYTHWVVEFKIKESSKQYLQIKMFKNLKNVLEDNSYESNILICLVGEHRIYRISVIWFVKRNKTSNFPSEHFKIIITLKYLIQVHLEKNSHLNVADDDCFFTLSLVSSSATFKFVIFNVVKCELCVIKNQN